MKGNNKLINRIILIIISFQSILTGIFLIIQANRIYHNSHEYTYELVKEKFLEILVLLILWVVFVIIGGIYFNIKNIKDKPLFSKYSNADKYITFKSKIDLSDKDDNVKLLLKNEKKIKIAWLINTIVILLCSFMVFSYLFNKDHFLSSGNLTEQVKKMVYHILPFIIISFASSIAVKYYVEKIYSNCIDLCKSIISTKGKKENTISKSNKIINILRFTLLALSLVLIIHGSINGGYNSVMQKASAICTECIGLG